MTDKFYSEDTFDEFNNADIQDLENEEISEDSLPYKLYLEEINNKRIAATPELKGLYQKLSSGDLSVTEDILNSWLLRITEIAKFYKSSPAHNDDLIQEGNMALWIALTESREFDVDKFDTYLESKVKEAMEDHIRDVAGDSDWLQAVLGKASLLHEATLYLEKENGATPSIEQLSEFTHITNDEIKNILSLYSTQE